MNEEQLAAETVVRLTGDERDLIVEGVVLQLFYNGALMMPDNPSGLGDYAVKPYGVRICDEAVRRLRSGDVIAVRVLRADGKQCIWFSYYGSEWAEAVRSAIEP